MELTDDRAANRCLPLLIANQSGWLLLNRNRIEATWSGGDEPDAITINAKTPGYCAVSSHFGYGILTWSIPFLFRTPPGYNLLVRAVRPIYPKMAFSPLDGVVETDWAEAVFTMNWKFTRPDYTVVFEPKEPICMVVPQLRGDLERFQPVVRSIESAPDEQAGVLAWSASREQFIAEHELPARAMPEPKDGKGTIAGAGRDRSRRQSEHPSEQAEPRRRRSRNGHPGT